MGSVNDVVGRTIRVKKGEVNATNFPEGSTLYTFIKGDTIGVVDSYIFRNGRYYWQFYNPNIGNSQGSFYIKHDPDKLEMIGSREDDREDDGFLATITDPFGIHSGSADTVIDPLFNKVILILGLVLTIILLPKIIEVFD